MTSLSIRWDPNGHLRVRYNEVKLWWHLQSYWVFCFGFKSVFLSIKTLCKSPSVCLGFDCKSILANVLELRQEFCIIEKLEMTSVARQNNKEQPQCTVMFHLTASKIQMSFTGFVLPWLPLKRSQAVNLFTQSKHKPESADFVLLGKCLSVKKQKEKEEEKKKTRGLKRFLSSSFAASKWSLYCPFCPISPQRKGEIRTNLRSNPLHLSVLLQKQTSIQTITPSEPHRNRHFHQSAASLPLPSLPSLAARGPLGSMQFSFGYVIVESTIVVIQITLTSVRAIYGVLSNFRSWCTVCSPISPCAMFVPVTPSGPPVEKEGE